MNEQAVAILNGAIAQLQALSGSQQGQIDTDNLDLAEQQAKVAADQADIALQTANKGNTDSIVTALQGLLPAPVPA